MIEPPSLLHPRFTSGRSSSSCSLLVTVIAETIILISLSSLLSLSLFVAPVAALVSWDSLYEALPPPAKHVAIETPTELPPHQQEDEDELVDDLVSRLLDLLLRQIKLELLHQEEAR